MYYCNLKGIKGFYKIEFFVFYFSGLKTLFGAIVFKSDEGTYLCLSSSSSTIML